MLKSEALNEYVLQRTLASGLDKDPDNPLEGH